MTVNQPNKTTFRKSNWYFMGIIFQVNANRYFRVEFVCGFFRLNKHVVVRCGSQLVLLSSTKFQMHKLALITTKHKCSGALDGSAMSRFINLHVFTKIHVFKLIIQFEGRSSTFFLLLKNNNNFFFVFKKNFYFSIRLRIAIKIWIFLYFALESIELLLFFFHFIHNEKL